MTLAVTSAERSTGSRAPLILGVLVSGSGSNLQAILDAIDLGELDAKVALVVSNVSGVKALERAAAHGVPTLVIDHRSFSDRRAFDRALVDALLAHRISHVVLAGFMRIVTNVLLDAFPHRVVNVHPSLLPAFPGVDAQAQALRYGVRVAGCTVHFVDGGTDTGPILAQATVPVLDTDDVATLRDRILVQEHALLPKVLQWIAEGRVHVLPAAEGSRPRVRVASP